MKRIGPILGALIPVATVLSAAVLWAVSAPPEHTIYAPTSVSSGVMFVAAWDGSGCGNKPPVVTWNAPAGCAIEGQGNASARFTCLGSRGTVIPLTATATAGRPPASCNGSASTSVVLAGGPAIACCPKVGSTGDGADPGPAVAPVAPSIYAYVPGTASTGRLNLAISVCQECP